MIHQQVRLAVRRVGALGERLDLVALGDVDRHRERLGAERPRLAGDLLHERPVEVREGEAHALARAFERQRPADAARRAGDHGDPPRELLHRSSALLDTVAQR